MALSIVGRTDNDNDLDEVEVDSDCDSDDQLVIDEIDETDERKNFDQGLQFPTKDGQVDSNLLSRAELPPCRDEMVHIHQMVICEEENPNNLSSNRMASTKVNNQGNIIYRYVAGDGNICRMSSGKCSVETQTECITSNQCKTIAADFHRGENGPKGVVASPEHVGTFTQFRRASRSHSNSSDDSGNTRRKYKDILKHGNSMVDLKKKKRLERNNHASKRYQAKQKEEAENFLKVEREIEESVNILKRQLREGENERDHLINCIYRIISEEFFNINKEQFCESFSKLAIFRDRAMRERDNDSIKVLDKLLQHGVEITHRLNDEQQKLIKYYVSSSMSYYKQKCGQ
uniref:BZIP domain-containing protein n=1 Tax=Clytia hemisphaerica TaxID=252671 RepID=A0A7M5WUM0_9CNID|eukprot:TCONS_00001534-protein